VPFTHKEAGNVPEAQNTENYLCLLMPSILILPLKCPALALLPALCLG
jgi:hypothetical protein